MRKLEGTVHFLALMLIPTLVVSCATTQTSGPDTGLGITSVKDGRVFDYVITEDETGGIKEVAVKVLGDRFIHFKPRIHWLEIGLQDKEGMTEVAFTTFRLIINPNGPDIINKICVYFKVNEAMLNRLTCSFDVYHLPKPAGQDSKPENSTPKLVPPSERLPPGKKTCGHEV